MTKQEFVQELGQLLAKAGIQQVSHIEWDDVSEEATVYYGEYGQRTVNCACDSKYAILLDIANHI